MISDRCRNCGKRIYLVKVGRTWRWMDNPKKPDSWGCGSDPVYKTMTHGPQELFDAQDRARQISQNDAIKSSGNQAPETKIKTLYYLGPEEGPWWKV